MSIFHMCTLYIVAHVSVQNHISPPSHLSSTPPGENTDTSLKAFSSRRQHMSTSAHRRWKVEGTDWAQNWTSLLLRMTPAQIKARPLAVVDTTTARIKDVDICPCGASSWGPAAGTESISGAWKGACPHFQLERRSTGGIIVRTN